MRQPQATFTADYPCKVCGTFERSVKWRTCMECRRRYHAAYREKHLEHCRENSRRWARENRDKIYAGLKRRYDANPQHVMAIQKRAKQKRWETYYKPLHKYWKATYRAALDQRTPKWVDREELKRIYRDCPPGMEVDHIVPLRAKLASGLHVPWNLQYLTKSQNSRKRNVFDPEQHTGQPPAALVELAAQPVVGGEQ